MYRVIVIDSDPSIHAALRPLSDGSLAQIVQATSNAEAAAILEGGQDFDLALVDIDGDGAAGLDVFRSLTRRDVRVARIGLTSTGDIGRIRDALHGGAVDILIKPIVLDDVSRTFERVMKVIETRRRNWNERAEYSALQREIQIAAAMQQGILPKQYPDYPGLEVFGTMIPAKVMGGDLFDVFALSETKVGFFIGDVSGKSVPAAFYMAVARTLLRSISENIENPGDCFAKVDALLSGHEIPGTFVTAFLGVLDTRNFDILYANAGHPLPMIVKADGRIVELEDGRGTVLGIGAGLPYEQARTTLLPGECLVAHTDGVAEAFNVYNEPYGEARLAEVLQANVAAGPEEICGRIVDSVTAFCAGRDQHDDLTVLALKRAG